MHRILIGGDIVPTKSNYHLFSEGDVNTLFGDELIKTINASTHLIFNLECPLVDDLSPIEKSGPALWAPKTTVETFKKLRPSLITLANNHIMDQGSLGLYSTLKLLDDCNISHIGAGENLSEARAPYYINIENKKVGVYACAEHEFSIITRYTPGANPIDLLETPDVIENLKKTCDFLIILYHGGKEYYRYPSPQLQKVCRKLVDKGADLIICQHSHCIGSMEKYNNGTIIYGQGNFLFDGSEDECWQTSMLIALDENFNIEYIPIEKKKNVVRLSNTYNKNKILNEFFSRSTEILSEKVINEKYDKIVNKEIDSYLLGLSGIRTTVLYFIINKIFFHKLTPMIVKCKYNKKKLLSIKNHIECEPHRELLLNGLNQKLKSINKK